MNNDCSPELPIFMSGIQPYRHAESVTRQSGYQAGADEQKARLHLQHTVPVHYCMHA